MSSDSPKPQAPSARTRVRQAPARAHYDADTLHQVLDACLVGHVSFVVDDWPMSIPTAIARLDDWLYLHGSRSSRLYQVLAAGAPVSVSVCLVDGLVKARTLAGFIHLRHTAATPWVDEFLRFVAAAARTHEKAPPVPGGAVSV